MGKEPFNLPAPLVTPELSTVLGSGLFTVFPVRGNQLDAPLGQFSIQRVAVIGFIPNQLFRFTLDVSRCESLLYQGDFMWASRRKVQGETSTSSVRFAQTSYPDIAMTLLPLPLLVLPTSEPLFSRDKGTVDKTLAQVKFAAFLQILC